MNFLKNIFTNSTAEVVKEVGDALDKNLTTTEEKLKIKLALEDILFNYKMKMLDIIANFEHEITERWKSDNLGNTFTRMIRPFILAYLTVIITILAITDGNFFGIVIKSQWIELFQYAYITVVAAYFGGRSFEKATIFKKSMEVKDEKMERDYNSLLR